MPRLSIYVPGALKARMDERPEINWSAVAQKAFDLEMRLRASPGDQDMHAAVGRLRASKEISELEDRPEWVRAGRLWAMNDADYDDLKSIARIGTEFLNPLWDKDEQAYRLTREIACARFGDEISELEIKDTADVIGGPDYQPNLSQLEWWLEGVRQIWNEVEREMD